MRQQYKDDFWHFIWVGIIVGVIISVLTILFGCQSAPISTASQVHTYELTLNGTIDGSPFSGIGVGSSDPNHNLSISSSIEVDYFTMQSCHRSVQFNDVIQMPWYNFIWGSDNKSFSFQYDEAPTIEDNGDCILRFCAYSKTVGSPPVSCAIVDFKAAKFSLPFENICNGADGQASGTALCHTQVGLIERVRFKTPVMVAPQVVDPAGKTAPYWIAGQCQGKFIDQQQTLWEYVMPQSECTVRFMELAKPHRFSKLTVIPYTDSLYPGGT